MSTIRRLHQFLVAIAIVAAVSIQFSGSAQTLSGAIGVEHQDALRALGQALASAPDRLDPLLAQLGFSVTRAPEGFTDWPTVRKLEAAYLSASAGGTPEDGERFLRTLSRAVAADVSNAIRYEKPLAPFFPELASGPLGPRPKGAIQWGEIPRGAPANLAPEARNAIASISRYVDRVPGGMQSMMAGCCGTTPSEAYEILRTTSNRSDALAAAIARGRVPPTVIERLARAARVVHDSTNAVHADARLNDALIRFNGGEHGVPASGRGVGGLGDRAPAEVNATLDARLRVAAKESQSSPDMSNLAPSGSPGGGGGGGGGTPDANLRRFRSAQAEVARGVGRAAGTVAASAGRTSFRAMRGVARGFGGVVFGAQVRASTGLAKPIQMSWVDDTTIDGVSWGHFDLVTDGHEVWMTKRMRAADAYAAVEIIRGRRDVFPALDVAGEEGVGVAGVAGGQLVELRRFLVHPALYGLAVGEAAVLADATGFMMSSAQLERHLAAAGVSAERRADAARWHTARNGFYKITDVPLLVVLRDGVVRVERTPDGGNAEGLRQIAFLTFQAYGEDGTELPESSRPFYKIVPGLTTALPHFDQLNQFAETFALVRWGAMAKARITPPPPPPRRSNVRTAVKRSATGAIGVISEKQFLSELPTAARREIAASETRAAAILKKGNASAHATLKSAEIFAKIRDFVERSITRDVAQTMSASTTPGVVQFAIKRADEAKAALPSDEPSLLIAQMVSPEQALQFRALIVRVAQSRQDTSGLDFLRPRVSPEEALERFIARELPWFFEWYAEVAPLLTAPPWGE